MTPREFLEQARDLHHNAQICNFSSYTRLYSRAILALSCWQALFQTKC